MPCFARSLGHPFPMPTILRIVIKGRLCMLSLVDEISDIMFLQLDANILVNCRREMWRLRRGC